MTYGSFHRRRRLRRRGGIRLGSGGKSAVVKLKVQNAVRTAHRMADKRDIRVIPGATRFAIPSKTRECNDSSRMRDLVVQWIIPRIGRAVEISGAFWQNIE